MLNVRKLVILACHFSVEGKSAADLCHLSDAFDVSIQSGYMAPS